MFLIESELSSEGLIGMKQILYPHDLRAPQSGLLKMVVANPGIGPRPQSLPGPSISILPYMITLPFNAHKLHLQVLPGMHNIAHGMVAQKRRLRH